MGSRIFWILMAGAALVAGMVVQDGDSMFGRHDDREISASIDRSVDREVDRGVARMEVVDSGGREIIVPRESKRELAAAIGRLVEAETDLKLLRIRDANDQEVAAATTRRNHARAEFDQLKADIRRHDQARDATRKQIRDDIRETVRDAVRN